MGCIAACLLAVAVFAGCGDPDGEGGAASPPPDAAAVQRAGIVVADACRPEHTAAEVERAVDVLVAAQSSDPDLELGHGDGLEGAVPVTVRDQLEILLVDLGESDCPAAADARERLRAALER